MGSGAALGPFGGTGFGPCRARSAQAGRPAGAPRPAQPKNVGSATAARERGAAPAMSESSTDPSAARRVVRSACPLDCPDACELAVTTAGGRLVEVDAWPGAHNGLTQGFICGKVRKIGRHLASPERLTRALLRRGPKGSGEFEAVPLATALDAVEQGLRRAIERGGPEALLPICYGGSNGILTQDAADALFFRRLGAARLLRTLCAAPTGRALQAFSGRMPGVAYPDYPEARLIVLWGANPSASSIHLVPFIQAARERGARLVVVDPRRTPLAKQADLHLALRPGTDLPLALAIAGWLFQAGRADRDFLAAHTRGADSFERLARSWSPARAAAECGLEAAEIEAFARLYADSRPAVLRVGWGQERSRSGGYATLAMLALPAVAGHFGLRGGGYTGSQSGAFRRELDPLIEDGDPPRRTVNLNQVGRELLWPSGRPIQAAFVYNGNPLATLPQQNLVRRGLEREDLFTVVHDAVLTDTARYADVVLPATTFLEHREVNRSYGWLALFDIQPALAAPGDCLSNPQLFGELARRFGLLRSPDELDEARLLERAFARRPEGARVARERLEREGSLPAQAGERPVQFVDVFPGHADRKLDLWPAELELESGLPLFHYQADPGSPLYPLALISPARADLISSTFGQLVRGPAPLHLSPADAAARGLREGQAVRVFNQLGEVHVSLRIDPDLRPGVAALSKGLWQRSTLNGQTSNALCPDTLTDLGGGACFNDARVEVAALTG